MHYESGRAGSAPSSRWSRQPHVKQEERKRGPADSGKGLKTILLIRHVTTRYIPGNPRVSTGRDTCQMQLQLQTCLDTQRNKLKESTPTETSPLPPSRHVQIPSVAEGPNLALNQTHYD